MRKLIIIGAGGLGKEVAWTALAMNQAWSGTDRWELIGFADDNEALHGREVWGLRVVGRPEAIAAAGNNELWFHCAVGNNAQRELVAERCLKIGMTPASIIHPSVLVAPRCTIGNGTYIGAGSIVNPDVTIGRFVLINQRVAIGHDAVVEDFAQANPGAQINGACRISRQALIGSNASLHPGIEVGANAVVGSNSQVVRNVRAGTTVVGVPARLI